MNRSDDLNHSGLRRFPSLNALRAFEAAARHLSVTRAAEELHVSAPAVSAQIKSLEDYLETALFVRAHRRLALTEAGRAALPGLTDGFDALDDAVRLARLHGRNRSGAGRNRLTVTVPPSLATRWLVPRLEAFAGAYPQIDIRFDATMAVIDPDDVDVDVAIRYGPGGYRGLTTELLTDEATVAVCSPALAEKLPTPAELGHMTLLHVKDATDGMDSAPDWERALNELGVTGVDPRRGPTFSLQGLAAQAAIEGQGIALLGASVVELDLAAGRLVEPFPVRFPVRYAIWLVTQPERRRQSPVAEFCDWLLADVSGKSAQHLRGTTTASTAIVSSGPAISGLTSSSATRSP
jgi:LysR family glycine cleavage system transcriptional activator